MDLIQITDEKPEEISEENHMNNGETTHGNDDSDENKQLMDNQGEDNDGNMNEENEPNEDELDDDSEEEDDDDDDNGVILKSDEVHYVTFKHDKKNHINYCIFTPGWIW